MFHRCLLFAFQSHKSMSAFVIYRQLARRAHVFPQYYKDSLRARRLHRAHGKPEAEADKQEKQKEAAIPGLHRRPKKETNHYSIGSSRHLSSTKVKLLDKASEDRTPPQSFDSREAQSSEDNNNKRKHDPRAFRRCRPEYASTTLDLSRRPTAIQAEQAFRLLDKVAVLKGRLKTVDVAEILRELGHLHQEQMLLVRKDIRFNMLLQYLAENLQQFSHPQLLQVLESFVWLDLPTTHSILGLFESELIHRASRMSLHQLLLAADLWRCLGKQVPQFLKQLYDSVNLSLQHIGVAEFVQLLYMVGEGRHCPKYLVDPLSLIHI